MKKEMFKKMLLTAMCCLSLTAFAITLTSVSQENTTYGLKDDLPY